MNQEKGVEAGFAKTDITPSSPIPLSGFVARCNQPFTSVASPLFVRALALVAPDTAVVILAFDTLGLCHELHDRLIAGLSAEVVLPGIAIHWLLCCTHTHAAPATIELLGCGDAAPAYWRQLEKAAVRAARDAVAARHAADLYVREVDVTGLCYNRRQLLTDGSIVMEPYPAAEVVKSGPNANALLQMMFNSPAGGCIAELVIWGVHPIFNAENSVSADLPGMICEGREASTGWPTIFLQGAGGDINPRFRALDRANMTEIASEVLRRLSLPASSDVSTRWPVLQIATRPLEVAYGPALGNAELELLAAEFGKLAIGCIADPVVTQSLSDLLNVPRGGKPDPSLLQHSARSLQQWCQRQSDRPTHGCTLQLSVVRLGPIVLCFAGAEVFRETEQRLQRESGLLMPWIVGCAGSVVGYLVTDGALAEGGYEVEYAHKFYNHPAPFALGSEDSIVSHLLKLIRSIERTHACVRG